MAKFKVKVTVTAQVEYEVELDGFDEESDAEQAAIGMWREKTPSDFQVEKGYITDWDTEANQLTWECDDCRKQISKEEYNRGGGYCAACAEVA